jgi:hypothetical protein
MSWEKDKSTGGRWAKSVSLLTYPDVAQFRGDSQWVLNGILSGFLVGVSLYQKEYQRISKRISKRSKEFEEYLYRKKKCRIHLIIWFYPLV